MKRVVKLLLAVLVLCGACDAVGLGGGGSGNGGTGGGGNINLVGTTWQGTYQHWSYDNSWHTVTATINFTSSDKGTMSESISGGDYYASDFYYSVSGDLIIFTHVIDDYTVTEFGSLAGGVLTITDDDGEKITFHKV